jgi:prefoldin subunit 5
MKELTENEKTMNSLTLVMSKIDEAIELLEQLPRHSAYSVSIGEIAHAKGRLRKQLDKLIKKHPELLIV